MSGELERGVGQPWPGRFERWIWVAVAVGVAAALYRTLTPGITGFFHDDAIYASGAMSLADGQGYRLANLPGAPYQTKYPPFFSAVLALAWWVRPEFPSNVLFLKALNLAFMAAAALAFAFVVRAQNRQASWLIPVYCQVALLTNHSMVGLANYTMTDVLFAAVVVIVLFLWDRGAPPVSMRREAVLVLAIASAILTRSVGIALAAAVVIDSLLTRQRVRAIVHAGAALAVMAAWQIWASQHRTGGSLIVDYYQTYERPAFSYLRTDPVLAFQIIGGNVRLAVDALSVLVGPLWAALLWPALPVLIGLGGWHLARSGWRFPVIFAGCYLGLVLMHPWAPTRYLLPLVPVLILMMIAGATHLWTLVRRLPAPVPRPASFPAILVLLIVLLGNLLSFTFRMRPGDNIRGWNGVDAGYAWSGFEDTFAWISRHTPPDAKLGGLFDTMYFLYTGRQAVRPWFHRPETYFYPYGSATPFVGRPEEVASELRALGVDYLVFDPPAGRFEGEAAMALLRAVVALPQVNGRLVFRSADGLHEVYRLWNPSAVPPGGATADPAQTSSSTKNPADSL